MSTYFYFLTKTNVNMEKFYFFNSFLETARAIEDKETRLEYLMAVAEYGIEWKESDNPLIKALMVQTKFTLDRSKEISASASERWKMWWRPKKEFSSNEKPKKANESKTKQMKAKQSEEEEEVEEEIKEIKENEFELFWKEFPHARKWKKQEAKKFFNKQDSKQVMDEIKLLNWKVQLWIQDWKYIPACERWIRDFTPTSEFIKKQDMEKIIEKHMWMEDKKERYTQLKTDFWEEYMNELVKEYNDRKKIQLSFKD